MKENYPRWKQKEERSDKQALQRGNLKDQVLPKASVYIFQMFMKYTEIKYMTKQQQQQERDL